MNETMQMEKKQSLFEITDEVQRILDLVEIEMEASGGDITEGSAGAELMERLKKYEFKVREKLDAYASVIKVCEADGKILKDEAGRMAARAMTFENTAKRLKKLLHFCMLQLGTRKIQSLKFTAGIQLNGGVQPMKLKDGVPSIPPTTKEIEDAINIALPSFVRASLSWDTDAIRAALAGSDPIAKEKAEKLAELLPVGEHLRIR